MGEAKRRAKKPAIGFRDFTLYPEELEREIAAGRCVGVIGLHKLRGLPGQTHIGMMNGGLPIREVFDILCIMRRSLMEQHGFTDKHDSGGDQLLEVEKPDASYDANKGGIVTSYGDLGEMTTIHAERDDGHERLSRGAGGAGAGSGEADVVRDGADLDQRHRTEGAGGGE